MVLGHTCTSTRSARAAGLLHRSRSECLGGVCCPQILFIELAALSHPGTVSLTGMSKASYNWRKTPEKASCTE